ncbi:MAG: hypothetical protein HYX28_05770 [Candidatus Koribacter versatilis]|uniref:Uncharacterized protein n=1 Tax=Candidatus Korobacter versatilis TaxID=658062 RepID=A0A932EPK2_9BACT|nr:hypothetical protein [Candidatus Koribacter versatilis]
MAAVWLKIPQTRWHLDEEMTGTFTRYIFAWLAGTLGGALFAMKWLYHTVGHTTWHADRRPWRYLTPHISGGLAFAMFAIVRSVVLLDPRLTKTTAGATAIGFLVGFFSDNAVAKLADVAKKIFGGSEYHT